MGGLSSPPQPAGSRAHGVGTRAQQLNTLIFLRNLGRVRRTVTLINQPWNRIAMAAKDVMAEKDAGFHR
jgi:hypothetical protein